jgi:hypothetical protein
MTRPNAMIVENGYATIAVYDPMYDFDPALITTTGLREDRYVRIDDGKQYPQLCKGARTYGNTLIYHTDEQLARDCNARLLKTREGFERAVARMAP